MEFSEYQKQSRKTAIYPSIGFSFVYPAFGLAGESGEVLEKLKKVLRDKNGIIDQETKEQLEKEIGDVLWYISNLSTELKIDLNEVAEKNLKKLFDRQNRNKLHGSGDNR